MGKPIEITRLDRSASELRELAVKTEDGDIVRRLLGIALLLDRWSRDDAATASGMDRQTLCDWVHRCRLPHRRDWSAGAADVLHPLPLVRFQNPDAW